MLFSQESTKAQQVTGVRATKGHRQLFDSTASLWLKGLAHRCLVGRHDRPQRGWLSHEAWELGPIRGSGE